MPPASRHTLANVPLFLALGPGARAELEARCAWRSFGPTATIVHFGDTGNEVYFMIEGQARVMIYSSSGRVVPFRDIAAGEFFGEYSAIDGRARSASVEAREPSLVAIMPGRELMAILEHQPGVTLALLRHTVAQMRGLTQRVFEFSTLLVRNRVHAELLRLANAGTTKDGRARIAPAPTHAEIANRISTNREAVTRELNDLQTAGVIARPTTREIVCDLEKLQRLVEEGAGH